MKIFDFEQSLYHLRDGVNISSCSLWVRPQILIYL
jgi:hypothetical protein